MSHPSFDELLNARLLDLERSQSWLARRLGMSRAAVARWCSGETRPGTVGLVIRITDVLGIHGEARQLWVTAAGYGVVLDPGGGSVASDETYDSSSQAPYHPFDPTDFDIDFYREAIMSWVYDFLEQSEPTPRVPSSWAARVLDALRAVTNFVSPQRFLGFLVALLLWLLTAWLLAPALHWPLDEVAARQAAFFRLGAATVLIPLLVAAVTRPDGMEWFILHTGRQKQELWLLKIIGALVGFYVFLVLTLGVALIWHYLGQTPLPLQVRVGLAATPLFFGYVVARQIPLERCDETGKVHFFSADWWFLGVFAVAGLLTSLFVYLFYWLFADRVLGAGLLCIALLVVTLERLRARGALSDPLFILLVGGGTTLALLALSVYAMSGSLSLPGETLPFFLMLSQYPLSLTLLGTTLFIRRRFAFTLQGALGALLASLLCLLALMVDLAAGLVVVVALLAVWFVWGRNRFRNPFHVPGEFWLLFGLIGGSAFLLFRTTVPLWTNGVVFLLLFALLMQRAYQRQRRATGEP